MISFRLRMAAASGVVLWTLSPARCETVIPVWPGTAAAEAAGTTTRDADGERRTRNVTAATLTVHLPEAGKANGTAVIICPGGGYRHLAIDKEGHDVARWLAGQGVAGLVLSYRVLPVGTETEAARRMRGEIAEKALADAERAIRVTRSRAAEWRIDPERIGILGFSAGGNVVVNVGLHFDKGNEAAADPVERQSSRPAFLGMIYAAAPEGIEFPKDAPPAFLAHAADDTTVPVAQSLRLFEALRKAGSAAEMHVYERGGHGFGVRGKGIPTDGWTERLREWMSLHQWTR
ncbi:MAG: alpha/beta hydrolase [Bryobacteraceae bacterium]